MSEPILPFISADDVGKSEATVVKVDGREIKKNPIDVGEDGLRILQIIAGVISASTKSLGSSIRHIFLENGKLSVSTADVGSSKKPVYMSNGEVKASDANVGSRVKPVYMEGGEIKESNANVGDDGLRLLKMVNGELQVSTSSKGSNIKFVYVQNGEVKETSVTLGSGIKHIYLQDGELKVSDSSVGGKIEVYDVTTDENPVADKHYFKREADNTYTDITSELSTDADLQSMGYTVFELKETKFAPTVLKGGSIAVDDANVGSNACFLYMQNGELRASTLTAGTNAKLLKIVNGEVKEATDNIGGEGRLLKIVNGQIVGDESTTVGDGSSIVYLSEGKLVKSTDTVGSDTKPVKLDNGSLVPVAKDLATKEAPALERAGEPRPDSELSEAEKLVPTSPTPTASDPGSMIATKEYVDNFSTESATYGYGVVDGSICTDAGDNLCITTISVDTTTEEVEYKVQNDCYLYIEVNGIKDLSGDADDDYIVVKVNDAEVGRLMDVSQASEQNGHVEQDEPSLGIHVAKGSIVKITGKTQPFHTGSGNVKFTEYRLAPISPSIEMPKYSKDEAFDIHIAAFSEEGYLATRRGYLLASIFDERGVYVPSDKSMKIYINDILVMNGRNIVKQVLIDSILDDPSLISKDAGSVKRQTVTREANTITLNNPDNFKVYTVDVNPATDKYEYIVALNPGTVTDGILTFDESLINYDVVVVDGVRQIEDIKLTDTGSCLIPVNYHDVIKIRAEKNGADEFGSAATWPSNFVYTVTSDTTPEATKRYYKETSDGMIDITEELIGSGTDISTLGYTVYEGTYVDANHDGTTDTTEHRWQAIFLRTRHHVASRDDDPVNKDQFLLGGFMTGEMFKDSIGNDLITLVPYTEWAGVQDAQNRYTYKYTVKNDCMLYANFLVHAHTSEIDLVSVTLNGKEFDVYTENTESPAGELSDADKQIAIPLHKGTVIGFHSKSRPNHNRQNSAGSITEQYAIKIKEYMLVAGNELDDDVVSKLKHVGNVIDGSVCTDLNGRDCVTTINLASSGANKPSYSYTVNNDCLLLIEVNNAVASAGRITVKVNDSIVGTLCDRGETINDACDIRIPVLSHSVITLVGDGETNVFSSVSSGSFLRFTEYKLIASHVVAPMPDWDESKAVEIHSGATMEDDGFIIYMHNNLTEVVNWIKINDVQVGGGINTTSPNNSVCIPVSKGDVFTYEVYTGYADYGFKFYPVKMTKHPDKMIVPNWSGTGTTIASGGAAPADGWIVVNAANRLGDGGLTVLVNGVSVWRSVDGGSNTKGYTANIPVAKNDIVTVSSDYATTITFYPAKPATTVPSEADMLEEKVNRNTGDISSLQTTVGEHSTEIDSLKNVVGDPSKGLYKAVADIGMALNTISKVHTITLADALVSDGIFDMAKSLMLDTGVLPSTSDESGDYAAGRFAVPSLTGYDMVSKFLKGVTEEELRTMTGNENLSLEHADVSLKLVTYRLSGSETFDTTEQYEELDPTVLVGGPTGPRQFFGSVRPIIRKSGDTVALRIPWPGKFLTNSVNHWSQASTNPTFYPIEFCDLSLLGDSSNKYYGGDNLHARVVLVIKQCGQ